MTATADRTPVMVFAEEIDEGSVVQAQCRLRTAHIKDDDDRLTGFASCEYLSRPHLAADHTLTIERLRVGLGAVRAITRNEDGEQVAWQAHRIEPVRTLQ